MLYSTLFLFAGILVLLDRWQQHVDRPGKVRIMTEVEDSRARGTNRGITQHPQIDPLKCMGCGSCVRAFPENGVLGMVNGTAQLVHASRCLGHGACERACPIGNLTVGLGDVTSRPDLPVLSSDQETSVPGVYIAGELSGMSLIRNAVTQGSRTIDGIVQRLSSRSDRSEDVVDVLVVGAGPAGLAATLRAMELNLTHVTIDQEDIGGTIRKYPRGKLTMTQPMDLPLFGRLKKTHYLKEELVEIWKRIITEHRVNIRTGVKLTGIERHGNILVSKTSCGEIRSRTVVLALGRRGTPRKLGVEDESLGKVVYQLVDAAAYRGQHLLVVGGGDSAVEAALALAEHPGNTVTLSYRKPGFFRLKTRNEERLARCVDEGRIRTVFSSRVQCITPTSVTLIRENVSVENESTSSCEEELPNHQVFVFAGGEPPYPLLRGVGIRFFADAPSGEESCLAEKAA